MRLDQQRREANIRQAGTEDLLDRVTVYREGMENDALCLIEDELHRRGIGPEAIAAHAAHRGPSTGPRHQGLPVRCAHCERPAVVEGWFAHRLWGVLPLFPRWQAFCADHQPGRKTKP